MAIESFLKVDKADPDWAYSPSQYFGKQFKMIDANCLQIKEGTDDVMILRLSPTENERDDFETESNRKRTSV